LVNSDPVHGDTYSHPAYGQITASRVTGQANLYGSDFEHRAFVVLRIGHSELHRNLSTDWHFGHRDIVELAMSEAQWATFVSSLNMGDGTPCTLQFVKGEGHLPRIPHRTERDVVGQEVEEFADQLADKVEAARLVVEGLTKNLSKKKQSEIIGHLESLEQDLRDNVPFHVKQFGEHIETTVEKAKIEIGAYTQMAIQRAGLKALTGDEEPPIRMITDGDDTYEEL
ncbi:unnamed protein product, partial [marine sediment metagenome]